MLFMMAKTLYLTQNQKPNNMLEIACFNSRSALVAASAGASRIELCDDASVGGITPVLENFASLKNNISIPIYVMIRPRGGNFTYTDEEYQQMQIDIEKFKEKGADGFVFGILASNNQINEILNKKLVDIAHPIPCTFHRAFDYAPSTEEALEKVIECGFKTILTSGSKTNVVDGKETLATLVRLASNRIEILCGGGLRSSNIEEIQSYTGATSFHSSALTNKDIADAEEIKKLKERIHV